MSGTKVKLIDFRWTSKEKLALLMAIREHGPENTEKLARAVKTKSIDAIRRKLTLYRQLAQHESVFHVGDRPKLVTKKFDVGGSLTSWLNAMAGHSKRSVHLATALRLISHLEKQPEPNTVSNVDLRKIYLHLADLIENKTTASLDSSSNKFLSSTIKDLASKIANETLSAEKTFVENITRLFPDNNVPQMTTDLPTARDLKIILSSAEHNPLEIPDKFLKR